MFLVTRRVIRMKRIVQAINEAGSVEIARNTRLDLLLLLKPKKIIKRRVTHVPKSILIQNPRTNARSKSVTFGTHVLVTLFMVKMPKLVTWKKGLTKHLFNFVIYTRN